MQAVASTEAVSSFSVGQRDVAQRAQAVAREELNTVASMLCTSYEVQSLR